MSVLSRKDIARPVLPQETVPVPALNGDVIVRGLVLSDRLEFALNGHDQYKMIAEVLARCVRDAEGEPIFSVDEWQIFGVRNQEAVLTLFTVAQRLSGVGDDEKKDAAPS
jgi:hypothetical protein